jgi:hypothetical protein
MKRKLKNNLTAIVGSNGFSPTALQLKWLFAFFEAEPNKHPSVVLQEVGGERTTWYRWRDDPAFNEWLASSCREWFGVVGLTNVHKAIYRRAVTDSPTDAKVYLERFDGQYKPTTRQEMDIQAHQLNRPGAIERSRQRLETLLLTENQ